MHLIIEIADHFSSVTYNSLIDAATQQKMSTAQQLLCAGHRQL
jgi:hypothetical protein